MRVAVPFPHILDIFFFGTLVDLVYDYDYDGCNVSPVKCICINKSVCIYIPHNKKLGCSRWHSKTPMMLY